MGLGLLGRGVGDAEFLAKCGAEVLVTDLKSEKELAASVATLRQHEGISFALGGHNVEDFKNADLVIKGAGVPLDSKYIAEAQDADVEVTMSTALLARYARECGATVVGITGTRGKTTVTHMLHTTLKLGGSTAKLVHLGGNVRGVSTLALLPKIKDGDIVLLELDSWQLQGFGYEELSPHIAVFTNFYPDHLNYYKDMEEYFTDKANIFKFQNEQEGDTLIIGEQVVERVRAVSPPVDPVVAVPLPDDWHLKVPGAHNIENAALAREALASIGLSESQIKEGLESFAGVEGRLEYIGETKEGIKIYNDNNATTPEATLAALEALDGNIVLIAGGTDKGTELEEVAKEINKKCKKTFLLNESGGERLSTLLENAELHSTFADTVNSALAYARAEAQTKTPVTILFSPIFSSFGREFVNEYDRNDKFKNLIAKHL